MNLQRFILLFALAVALPTSARAHDLWIEPATFSPDLGQPFSVRLRVGEHLVGDVVAIDPATIQTFAVNDQRGHQAVAVTPRRDAGIARTQSAGLAVIGYESHATRLDLPAHRFNAYLAEEGLDTIVAARLARGTTDQVGREQYVRCAKSLVWSRGITPAAVGAQGGGTLSGKDRRIGLPLELVAEANPYAAGTRVLPVALTFHGKPQAGVLVVAVNSLDPSRRQAFRTGPDGRVRFAVKPGGTWLVKAVHMVSAPADSGVDWSSYWASLTFGAPAAGDGGRRTGVSLATRN